MTKSQFNIKISKDLLIKVKRQAMRSGKSLTEHITDLITRSLLDEGADENTDSLYSRQIKDLEERIIRIESVVNTKKYLTKD